MKTHKLVATLLLSSLVTSVPAQTPAPGTNDSTPTANPMLTDFSLIPREAAVGGPGIGTAQDIRIFTGTLQHEIVENLFVELAYNAQRTTVLGRDIGNTEIRVHWDTSPTLPEPKPRSKGGCGGLGMIIMIVVAIVATVFTAGVATLGFSGAMSAGFSGIMGAGMTALAGGAVAG